MKIEILDNSLNPNDFEKNRDDLFFLFKLELEKENPKLFKELYELGVMDIAKIAHKSGFNNGFKIGSITDNPNRQNKGILKSE
jgi:hypothetical protein